MKQKDAFTNQADLLVCAGYEDTMIKPADGTMFFLSAQQRKSSPFDVEGMDTAISTQDIVEAIRESRLRGRVE